MIDAWVASFLEGDWLFALTRLLFIGLVYLFLYLVLRSTARELAAVARAGAVGEGRAGQAALMVLDGASSSLAPGEMYMLQPRTVIGRIAGNELVADDPHVSARHAELRFERGQWWLRDLGSSNGTRLNDEPVRAVMAVRHGDVLQCGRVRFRMATSPAVPVERASA